MVKAVLRCFCMFLFFVILGLGQDVSAKESEIVLVDEQGNTTTFPSYVQYASQWIDTQVREGKGTSEDPIPVAYPKSDLELFEEYLSFLPKSARTLFAKPVDASNINKDTIFVNPLLKAAMRKEVESLDVTTLTRLLYISNYFGIDPVTNQFASRIAEMIHASSRDAEEAYQSITQTEKKYIKKHLRLKKLGVAEFSVGDFYGLYGQDRACFSYTLNFCRRDYSFTSFEGIERTANPAKYTEIMNLNGPILGPEYPGFSDKPFQGFTNLEQITIQGTSITELPPHFFDGPKRLQTVKVSNNKQLKKLAGNLFATHPHLRWIGLENNQLETLPEELFASNNQLDTVLLNNNKLKEVPRYLLNGLLFLKELNLSYNQLGGLPEGFFNDTTLLERLDLSHNELNCAKQIEESTPLPKTLVELRLNHNQFTHLTNGVFQHQQHVIDLYLQYNRLRELPSGVFQYMDSLQTLNMSHNFLEGLPDYLFTRNKRICRVNLSDNELTYAKVPRLALHPLASSDENHLLIHQNRFYGSMKCFQKHYNIWLNEGNLAFLSQKEKPKEMSWLSRLFNN